jgi:hypothetical protein
MERDRGQRRALVGERLAHRRLLGEPHPGEAGTLHLLQHDLRPVRRGALVGRHLIAATTEAQTDTVRCMHARGVIAATPMCQSILWSVNHREGCRVCSAHPVCALGRGGAVRCEHLLLEGLSRGLGQLVREVAHSALVRFVALPPARLLLRQHRSQPLLLRRALAPELVRVAGLGVCSTRTHAGLVVSSRHSRARQLATRHRGYFHDGIIHCPPYRYDMGIGKVGFGAMRCHLHTGRI